MVKLLKFFNKIKEKIELLVPFWFRESYVEKVVEVGGSFMELPLVFSVVMVIWDRMKHIS